MKFLVAVAAFLFVSSAAANLDENPCLSLPAPGHGFVNDYAGCEKYFSCIAFLPFRVSCPPGFYFDEGRSVCDLPANVNCNICPSSGIHAVGDATSCTKWTLCLNGVQIPQECAPGTSFDRSVGRCNLSEDVSCAADTCSKLDGGTGMAASPVSCESYHYCYSGEKLAPGTCQPGLAFDINTMRCVRAADATCFPGTSLRAVRRF